jgi:hypothetical protein
MSCHGMATAGPAVSITSGGQTTNTMSTLDYPAAYTVPISFTTDSQFGGFTRTDFSWAIPGNATNDLPPARR